jgi:2-polyprenyl-3-methyl-5-hydroxy-6-metoxy-1,4-benzoquinol methylase
VDKNKETFETWNKVAKLYQDKFMYLDLYDDTYDECCMAIKKENSTVLDIGCGPGNITKYLLKKKPFFKIKGIDTSENMIALAKVNNPTAEFDLMDCREISILTQKFDAIICGFCFPYLSAIESRILIKNCADLLNVNGIIYISFVKGNYLKSCFKTGSSGDRVYFYYYTVEAFTKELAVNNIVTLKIFKKKYNSSKNLEEIHVIIIAIKNE